MNSMYLKPFMTQVRPAKSPKNSLPAQSEPKARKVATAEPVGGTGVHPDAANASTASTRKVQVKRSGVHGKGVFANQAFKRGDVIIEYKGEIITWEEALRRHPHDPADPNHTFYFHIDDEYVIDGKYKGNAAKWINHACSPNCEADQQGKRVFIKAKRAIKPGDELFYDYGLVIDEPLTAKLKKEYACWCGSPKCKGTMLSGTK